MTATFALALALMGLIFIAWSFMMFRTLFNHRRRVAERTGRSIPNVMDALGEWKRFFVSPDTRTERRILIGLTLAMIACIGLMATEGMQ